MLRNFRGIGHAKHGTGVSVDTNDDRFSRPRYRQPQSSKRDGRPEYLYLVTFNYSISMQGGDTRWRETGDDGRGEG